SSDLGQAGVHRPAAADRPGPGAFDPDGAGRAFGDNHAGRGLGDVVWRQGRRPSRGECDGSEDGEPDGAACHEWLSRRGGRLQSPCTSLPTEVKIGYATSACPLPPPGPVMPSRFGRIAVAVVLVAVPAVAAPPGEVWWALRPLTAPQVPAMTAGGRNPIDAFIRAKLADKGLSPAPETDRRTLIRRVTFDLTGLPPTPEEIDAFVNDPRPDAYEQLVERLLASPAYGERWARHWLDLARYADSHGYSIDAPRSIWPYRDYV